MSRSAQPDYTIEVYARGPNRTQATAVITDIISGAESVATSDVSTEVAVIRALSAARNGGSALIDEACAQLEAAGKFVFCVLPAKQAFGPACHSEIKSCVLIIEASYWEMEKCLDDHHVGRKLPPCVRSLVSEVMESVFESRKEPDEIRKDLEHCGLRFSGSMQAKNSTAYFW